MSVISLEKIFKKILSKIVQLIESIFGIFEYNIISNLIQLPHKSVQIAVTYRCNSRCVMCNIWKMKPKNELRFDEWKKILKDQVFRNIESCSLIGGELFLYSQLLELVKEIIISMPKLKKISVVSNGFSTKLIVNEIVKIAKICNKKGIQLSVSISLDGVGKIHEKIRRIPDAFAKSTATLLALKQLSKKYDFWLGSGSLILRQNLLEVEKMIDWYKKNDIDGNFQIVGFHDTYVNNLDTKEDISFRKKEKFQLESFMEKMGIPRSWRDFSSYYWRDLLAMYRDKKPRTTPCPFQKDEFALDSFGDVYYCFSTRKIGNCRNGESIRDILFSKDNLLFKKKMLNSSCLGCNSGCDIKRSISRDFKKYLWFRMTGKLWYGFKKNKKVR